MSIFTPSIYNEPNFSGLFRLLDDFDNYRSTTASQNQQQQQQITPGSTNVNNTAANPNNANQQHQRQLAGRGGGGLLGQLSFTPRFDLRETDAAFELRGDLPGVEKDQVHIEFADEHTLTIRGRVEREWSSGSDERNDNNSNSNSKSNSTGAKPGEEKNDGANTGAGAESKAGEKQTSSSAATKTSTGSEQPQTQAQAQAKYWITERSVGEFSRSFRLTGHHSHNHSGAGGEVEIDHDGVTAKLDNGVLSVVVPKVVKEPKQARRKVQIN